MNREKERLNQQAGLPTGGTREKMIPVDGRGQVVEMLRAADPAFREQLLRQIERRDPRLAADLRRRLANA